MLGRIFTNQATAKVTNRKTKPNQTLESGVVVYACNLNTWEVEDQEVRANLVYMISMKPAWDFMRLLP